MKLAEWARMRGVHPQTTYRWFCEDRMPVLARRLESGMIWGDAAATMRAVASVTGTGLEAVAV
ncbi:hypothetical protein [Saccharopolyspora sp. NPDC002376]